MPQAISVGKRWEIVFLKHHPLGPRLSQTWICKELKLEHSVVKHWLDIFEETGDVQEKSKSGQPQKTTKSEDMKIVSTALKNREATSEELA